MNSPTQSPRQQIHFILAVAFLLSFLVHLLSSGMLGYHRDEFLYLALGNHPGFGHWSNPPFIGWMGFLSQNLFGQSITAIHVIPAIAGGLLTCLMCLIAKELGGKHYAILLAGIASLFHIIFLRAFSYLMPVPFDILFWTLFFYLILLYLNTEKTKYLLWLGIAIGFSMLNKYAVVFFVLALLLSTILTPHRKLFLKPQLYLAMGLGFLVFLPNLYWQYAHGFPVIHHMEELSQTQLQNVVPINFISDQFLMNWQNTLLFIPGIFFLLGSKKMLRYRLVGWVALGSILLFLVFRGKSYYTLGAYPVLIAAGAVFWEQYLKANWARIFFPVVIISLLLPVLPMALPIVSVPQLEQYFAFANLDGIRRWEDGQVHSLPQDYADMLGWQELADATGKAYQLCDLQKPVLIYAENYGQAGAIDHLGRKYQMPPTRSFADSYRLWNEDDLTTEIDQFIYVNDELGEDINALFADIIAVDSIRNPRAREYGTKVYLCRSPRSSFNAFWKEVKGE